MSLSTRVIRRTGGAPREWGKRYPPLTLVVVALALTIFALPSALNLPQANPGQTLEYAPVPGNQGAAPPGGNFAGLGLGSGGAGTASGAGGNGNALAPPPLPAGVGQPLPSRFNCVGSPPRQTEDPLSPPCSGSFQADNGGSTYPGVTGKEVRFLVYIQGGGQAINGSVPTSTYVDLEQAPQANENAFVTYYRNWQTYFNQRFQTYNRVVHLWVYFNDGTASVNSMRAEAADNLATVHPFAVMGVRCTGVDFQPYFDTMANSGVLNFGGLCVQRSLAAYKSHPGLEWGFQPPVEAVADTFSNWVCSKIKPNTVHFSGNNDTGQPRKYGFLFTTDSSQVNYQAMQAEAKSRLQACGIDFSKDYYGYPDTNTVSVDANASQVAQSNMANLKKDGVTTILWAGGYSSNEVDAAQSIGYFPEWVTADDWSGFDSNVIGAVMPSNEWQHAWVVSPVTLQDDDGYPVEPPCYQAYLSVDPNANRQNFDLPLACEGYDAIRMLFTGIQVAGPHLTPAQMDQGFHAIPAHPSSSPTQPACYYNSGDYTCEKDAVAMWWDPSAKTNTLNSPSGSSNGCWRMALNGQRFQSGDWPAGDPTAQNGGSNDVCNLYEGWV